jgi:flagellar hook-associated protein 3 FlgL
MRVTTNMTAGNSVYNLQQNRIKLDLLQEQISFGKKILSPSEDPIAARQLLDLEDKLKAGEQYLGNINKAKVWLNITDTALGGIADMIKQAKSVAAQIGSGSTDQTIKDNAVSQLTEIKRQLVNLGNTQLGEQYIFSGFNDATAPFAYQSPPVPPAGPVPNPVYAGTADDIKVAVDKGASGQLALNITGDKVLTKVGSSNINILDEIDKLIDGINNDNPTNIRAAALQIGKSSTEIDSLRSQVAGRQMRLESAGKMIALNKNTAQTLIENIQNVDMIKAATELNQQKTAFEAALSATAKISQISLLDYLK